MTLTRKLALALCLVFLCITLSSNAQNVGLAADPTTGNLINYGNTPTATTSTWNNGVYVNQLCFQAGQPGNCGPNPSIRSGGNINFSYGTVDLNQVVNINKALEASGAGVQLSGFNFGFTAKNGNGWDDGRQDYLAAYVKLYNSAGAVAANYDYSAQTNRRYNWTQFNFNETFAVPQLASQYSNAQVGFVGRDNNFWAGNYGPEITGVSFNLKYRVDPCATNPAYSPNCAGFKDVLTSGNLVPNPGGYAVFGDSINQSYAINTALATAGSAAQIHGFQWGYVANANGPYCATWFLVCFDERTPSVNTSVSITNSSGATIYSANRHYENSYNTKDYSYLFPTSQTMSTLGNFNFTATTNDSAYVGSMYSRALYTADPCAVNPLSSPTCSGYAIAYAKLLTSTSTTSSTTASYTGTISITPTSQVETSPMGVIDQTQPQQQTAQQSAPQTAPTPDATQSVAQADLAQPSPTQAGPAPSGSPTPAGGPPQATQTASSSNSAGPSASSAGPSKLAMSVLKTAQANDKATQAAAVQNAAKTLENATQSSQASSNLAISMNQDMSANSATAAANFASQTTQASQQTATQSSSGPQQTTQTSTQTTAQFSKLNSQEQQTQQETQQVVVQTVSVAQPQSTQQEQQQGQTQSSTSIVKLLPPLQQDIQQESTQTASVVQYQQPQQQESQTQAQSSTSIVKLLPPQQQTEQQTQSQMTAGMIQQQPSAYIAAQQQPQDTQSTQVSMLKPPAPVVVEVQQQASSGTGITVGRNPFAYNPLSSFNSSSMQSAPVQPAPLLQTRIQDRSMEVETPQMQVATFGGVGKAGNPLSEMMQQRFELIQNNISQPASSVNKNVQPNDLAGGVDLASMATMPAGFNSYSFVLKDAAFYEPKEVYKNQKTVDNVRLLRGLTGGSDSLHQRMVDSQYK